MNILIGCLLFSDFTGSEMYVLELAKGLRKLNCNVTVTSPNLGEKMVGIAKKHGIEVLGINQLNPKQKYDLIHCQHYPVVEYLVKIYPETKKVCTIHSEVISLENPFKHNSIKKYIAIRPEIQSNLINKFNISKDNISVIYNPIDEDKFKPAEVKQYNCVLFVGTIDYLRKNTIYDLIEYSKQSDKELWLVGNVHDSYLQDVLKNKHVKHSVAVESVEEYVQRCYQTAGILLGRTTIEGWMCGKSGWIYDVDETGKILSKKLYDVPDDIEKFHATNVCKQVKELYISII